MINNNDNQRTLEWHRMRWGCITGSKVGDLMGKGRGKDAVFSQTAMTYIYEIAGQRNMRQEWIDDDEVFADYIVQTCITNKAMQWGIDNEDAAIRTFLTAFYPNGNAEVSEVSSCKHDTIEHFAASPDGILLDRETGEQSVIEVKCPNIATFMKYRTEIHDAESLKACKAEYYWQMQAEMACTGLTEGRFITYHPYEKTPLHVAVIKRNDDDVAAMEERVKLANVFIEEIINKK